MTLTDDMQRERDAAHAVLSRIIAAHTAGPGDYTAPIGDLVFFRRETPAPPSFCVVEPSIVLVSQGAKQMLIGGRRIRMTRRIS